MHKSKKRSKQIKAWMFAALFLVIAIAVLLRGFVVYKVYPLDYRQIIEQRSKEYSLDPYLVSAVICAESRFLPEAVSPKGAVGLMQIMPDTGEWIFGKMGFENYNSDMLCDPDVNIHLGCWYLRYLYERFNGDMDKVLAAYNAGPRNVEKWAPDGALETIPFPETENYLKIVTRNYYIYKEIYNDF